jgi:hypothetical protein
VPRGHYDNLANNGQTTTDLPGIIVRNVTSHVQAYILYECIVPPDLDYDITLTRATKYRRELFKAFNETDLPKMVSM